jgi:hypothetical protein
VCLGSFRDVAATAVLLMMRGLAVPTGVTVRIEPTFLRRKIDRRSKIISEQLSLHHAPSTETLTGIWNVCSDSYSSCDERISRGGRPSLSLLMVTTFGIRQRGGIVLG